MCNKKDEVRVEKGGRLGGDTAWEEGGGLGGGGEESNKKEAGAASALPIASRS